MKEGISKRKLEWYRKHKPETIVTDENEFITVEGNRRYCHWAVGRLGLENELFDSIEFDMRPTIWLHHVMNYLPTEAQLPIFIYRFESGKEHGFITHRWHSKKGWVRNRVKYDFEK